ncbi:SDR family NAD(P)-dependent oxidoreductase [Chryseobacterium soli]|uniref:SDR family NAD(P)-dependent oxidoreductase n=1 Tax=Chryseobacterium soli TaxID=445961 RepID=UPI000689689D|nr:SDR family NAD(P)-dependent oxidoreductase [Chryseobacterium soli]
MSILENSVVFLTGADGGIGRAFIAELIQRKAKKIYITGLNLEALKEIAEGMPEKLFPVKLDVTNAIDIENCINTCPDVTVLINNAGVELKSGFMGEKSADCAQFEMQINYVGVVRLTNSFYKILKSNPNPAVINILSVGSLVLIDRLATYCASKAAAHMFTQSIRKEFHQNGIKVFGVYAGYVDTAMSADLEIEKISAEELLQNICNDVEADVYSIFPDKMSKNYSESNKLSLDFI